MNDFSWVLFDADDTLFHFDAFTGLQHLFAGFNLAFTEKDYADYELINKPLWVSYQNGSITAEQLQYQRFAGWAARLNCSPEDLNNSFIAIMAQICTPIEGALSLLKALKAKAKLGIITNGFTQLQQARLDRTGLNNYFDVLVISEQVGVAKPDKAIFEHTLKLMGNPLPSEVLMVGDNPASDILGGINAGLRTCWFNQHQIEAPAGITPHYEVASLRELQYLLVGSPDYS
ncbi:dUMP phosphatase [Legionella sp. km772]|nr:dUMP phosphatase [Legionella sp. km772]